MLRGTNRNESLHAKLNRIWPDKCGPELADSLQRAFVFKWNFQRENWAEHKGAVFNLDPSCVRICNLDSLLLLDKFEASVLCERAFTITDDSATGMFLL